MSGDEFCPDCDVALRLHEGSGSCDLADRRASVLELCARLDRQAGYGANR